MRFQAHYVVRVASAQSFAPLEHAAVSCGGIKAMHKDGGFYVFLEPLPVEGTITVSCPGYSASQQKCRTSGRGVVYLSRNGAPRTELRLMAALPAATGEQKLTVVFTDSVQPQILDGCTLDHGFGRTRIAGFDRAASVITLEEPLTRPLPHGMQLTVRTE